VILFEAMILKDVLCPNLRNSKIWLRILSIVGSSQLPQIKIVLSQKHHNVYANIK
ncbi:hypothetical protein L9F63_008706, partial [Diploptera punctata]